MLLFHPYQKPSTTTSSNHFPSVWTVSSLVCRRLAIHHGSHSSWSIASLILFVFWGVALGSSVTSSASISFPSDTAKKFFHLSNDGSYLFGYDTGPGEHQSFREESRSPKGTVAGSYGYVDPKGVLRITEYVADSKGYRSSLEIYKPVHHFPSGPPLIVGPIPADLDSRNERKDKKESVFDRYAFPIEPFESLKLSSPGVISTNRLDEIPERSSNLSTEVTGDVRDVTTTSTLSPNITEESQSSNETTFPVVDISTLQEELQLLSLKLKDEPLLIIGPLPGDVEEEGDISLKSSLIDLKELGLLSTNEMDTNSLEDRARTLRSSKSTITITDDQNYPSGKDDDKSQGKREGTSGLQDSPSSLSDSNFIDKDLKSDEKEQQIPSLSFPSSNLLQGEFVTLNKTTEKKSSRRHIKIRKRKLNQTDKININKKLLQMSVSELSLLLKRQRSLSHSTTMSANIDNEKTMKLISFQAQNIFRELLKLNPATRGTPVKQELYQTSKKLKNFKDNLTIKKFPHDIL